MERQAVDAPRLARNRFSPQYAYDAFGHRVERHVLLAPEGTSDQKYLYDGDDVLMDLDPAAPSAAKVRYLPGDATDQLFARYAPGTTEGDHLWYLQDRLGSVVNILPLAGASVKQVRYRAYGGDDILNTATSDFDRYQYTGREFDPLTRLNYHRARWYDSDSGRWMNQDPLAFEAGDSNLYRFVGNGPTNATDPTGLVGEPIGKAFRDFGVAIVEQYVRFNGQEAQLAKLPHATPQPGLANREFKKVIDDLDRGSKTGVKALVNAASDVGVSFVTLGFSDYQSLTGGRLWEVDQEDLDAGYNTSYWIMRVSGEFLTGVATAGATKIGHVGKLKYVAYAAMGWDVAGNVAQTGRGAHNVYKDGGLTWQNSVELFGGAAGLGGNALGGLTRNAKVGAYLDDTRPGKWLSAKAHTDTSWLQRPARYVADTLRIGVCFAAGTPLLTPEGSKNVEDFEVGDLILSREENSPEGTLEAKAVEEVFVRAGQIFHLHVAGQVIRTTAEHPFYVQGKGWTAADALAIGDLLASHDGQWMAVEDLFATGELETVYNLRVAECHTYFVGCHKWGFSVWAHNTYKEWASFRKKTQGVFHSSSERSQGYRGGWRSPGGLEYGPHASHGSVLRHVLKHVQNDMTKSSHGVFRGRSLNSRTQRAIELTDQAWHISQTTPSAHTLPVGAIGKVWAYRQGTRAIAYVVDMGAPIGRQGGHGIGVPTPTGTPLGYTRLVVEQDAFGNPTNRVITTFPQATHHAPGIPI